MSTETRTQGNGSKVQDELLHEYPALGRYRIRVVRNASKRWGGTFLDVREWVESEKYEGFTKRGIRLGSPTEMETLGEVLADAATRDWFKESRPARNAG